MDNRALAQVFGQIADLLEIKGENAFKIRAYRSASEVIADHPERVTALDASVGGIGGCPFAPAATGNIPSEDLCYMLGRMGVDTGYSAAALINSLTLSSGDASFSGSSSLRSSASRPLLLSKSLAKAPHRHAGRSRTLLRRSETIMWSVLRRTFWS